MSDAEKRDVLLKALVREGVTDTDEYIGNVVLETIERRCPKAIEVFQEMDVDARAGMIGVITDNVYCAIVCTTNTRDHARIVQPTYLHPKLSFRERIEKTIDEYFDEP